MKYFRHIFMTAWNRVTSIFTMPDANFTDKFENSVTYFIQLQSMIAPLSPPKIETISYDKHIIEFNVLSSYSLISHLLYWRGDKVTTHLCRHFNRWYWLVFWNWNVPLLADNCWSGKQANTNANSLAYQFFVGWGKYDMLSSELSD